MCISLTTVLMAAGSAVSAIGAIQQGRQAQAMGNYQAAQAQADASATRGQAEVEAAKIRKAGERQRSAAVASMAAAGVSSNVGTADLINKEITANAEEDAINTIFDGGIRAKQISASGQAAKINGSNSAKAGFLNAGTSALRGGSSFASGWKTNTRNVNYGDPSVE